MHNTSSDVSGTVIRGENQPVGTEGWGKAGERNLHETPWAHKHEALGVSKEHLKTRCYQPQIRITSNAPWKSRSERTQQHETDAGKELELKKPPPILFSPKVSLSQHDLRQEAQRTGVCWLLVASHVGSSRCIRRKDPAEPQQGPRPCNIKERGYNTRAASEKAQKETLQRFC